MYSIEFNYNGNNVIIQCTKDEKLKEICYRFSEKIQINKNDLYFS